VLSSREVFGWIGFWIGVFVVAGAVFWTETDARFFAECAGLSLPLSAMSGSILARSFELERWPRLIPGILLGLAFTLAPSIGIFAYIVWRT
jgi:hypothetical protein